MYTIKRNFGSFVTYVIDWNGKSTPIRSTYHRDAKRFTDKEIDDVVKRLNQFDVHAVYTKMQVSL